MAPPTTGVADAPTLRRARRRVAPDAVRVAPAAPVRRDVVAPVEPERQAALLAYAVEHLDTSQPAMCGREVLTHRQRVGLIVLAVLLVVGLLLLTVPVLILLVALATIGYSTVVVYRFLLFRRARDTVGGLQIRDSEALQLDHLPRYTVLVPAYKEPGVVPTLLRHLQALDYPTELLDIRLLLEEDDPETLEAVRRAQPPAHITVVLVPEGGPRTKPKALNYGLGLALGELVTVYDVEDRPDPLQLRKAVLTFRRSPREMVCLQARLGYFNAPQNLITRWFQAEYTGWFRFFLPGLVERDVPLPLGGTSNHVRRDALLEVGGWDPYNVTEDADLGIRLHRAGYRTGVLDSQTQEEATSDFVNWVRQRSRWHKGYLQTWLVHMRHPRQLRRELGTAGFLQFNLFVGGTPLLALLNPVFWSLTILYFLTASTTITSIFPGPVFYPALLCFVLGNALIVYLAVLGVQISDEPRLGLAAAITPVYWVMMSVAAYKALWQLVRNPSHWEKTEHGLDTETRLAGLQTPLAAPAMARPGRQPVTTVPRTYGLHIAPRLAGGLKRAVLAPLLADPPVTDAPVSTLAPRALVPGGAVLAASEHVPAHHRPPTRRRQRVLHALRPTENKIIFLVVLTLHLAIGVYVSLIHSLNLTDALARVSSANFIVHSRDPHLGAVGFVFGPLPALVMAPFVWLAEIFPALLTRAFLGNILSALCTAGGAVLVRSILRDLGVGRSVSLVLVVAFAAHPLVLFYGGSGMSELMVVFLLLVAARGLLRWMEGLAGPQALFGVGLSLGGAYLVRLEALGACLSVLVLVPVVTLVKRARHPQRLAFALNDLVLVGGPVVLLLGGYAVVSKLIVGTWSDAASSDYGNNAQVGLGLDSILDRVGATPAARLQYVADQVTGIQPQLLALLAGALLISVARRDARVVGVIAVFGSVLTVNAVLLSRESTFGWLRFTITAVPLAVLLGGILASRARLPRVGGRGWRPRRHPELGRGPLDFLVADRAAAWVGGALAVLALALAVPSTYDTLRNDRLAPQEAGPMRAFFEPENASQSDLNTIDDFAVQRSVAAYLDAKDLPDGSVVTDAASAYAVILASDDPSQFVATPDRDFEQVLADPQRFDAQYMLLIPPDGANFDALNSLYPTLYADGAGLGVLERTFTRDGDPTIWRLYRLQP